MESNKIYIDYAQSVVEGKITACSLLQAAARRFLADLDRPDLEFRADAVDRALRFISTIKHYTGKHAGKQFTLEPWQQWIIANIIGFYRKDTGTRRFTSSYIEIARKNGKTALSVSLCLLFLIADGEPGAEVLLAANSKDQAKIAFEMARQFARGLDPDEKLLRGYRADIFFDATASKLKVLAADDSKLDGFNASFGLIDEFHAAKNSRVRDVIRSSMGMRQNPHLCTITTAGFDKTSPCYQLRTVAAEVLAGIKEDDETFIAIYSLDEGDDWADPQNWPKANPNLGVTVNASFIRGQVQQAKNNPADEVGVKTKTLNIWCDASDVWIPEHYVNAATEKLKIEDFAEEDCYIGVDLGSTSDLTAVAKLFVRDGKYYFFVDYYLPESALYEKVDKELYKLWKSQGMLHITPGNVTDYDYITNELMALYDKTNIISIGYDKWNAVQWAIDATSLGLPLQEYGQTLGNFNKPTREIERLLLSGKVVLDANDITRFCFRNVRLKYDHNGNCKPDKGLERKKIDGVVAMLQALGIWLEIPHYNNEILTL